MPAHPVMLPCSGWCPVPTGLPAGTLFKRPRTTSGEGSPDLLALATLCCSPVLPGCSHTFPVLSVPLLVMPLPAKCTLPQELPCSCFVSFLSPQTSSPSVVQFQPASGSSCVTSPFTLTLLPPAHRSRSNPDTHTTQTRVCTAPTSCFHLFSPHWAFNFLI